MKTKTMTNLLRLVLIAAAALCGVFFFLCLPSYGQEIVQADPEFAWAYWPCLVWAWLFALPIFRMAHLRQHQRPRRSFYPEEFP